MARVTVEDCLQNVDNLFQLVLLASQRARRLANGAEATVPVDNDKATVLALRESPPATSPRKCWRTLARTGGRGHAGCRERVQLSRPQFGLIDRD